VIDKNQAWNEILTINDFGSGNSRSNSMFWIASRKIPAPSFPTYAPAVSYNEINETIAIKPPPECSVNSACDAQGV
jgi:hypothetical protein